MGAGGPEHVRLDGGGDQVALPLQDGRDDQAVGLERPGRAEGQDRVALLDGQVQAAEEAVAEAVAAAQDDPPSPRAHDEQAAQLPQLGPPWRRAGGAGGGPVGRPAGPAAHRARAGSQKVRMAAAYMPTGPGSSGWEQGGQARAGSSQVPGSRRSTPSMSTSRTGRCCVGAEEDGGDLADQPHQPAGGEQQRRHHQPEGVRDDVVVAIAVAVTPHPAPPAEARTGCASRRQRQRR